MGNIPWETTDVMPGGFAALRQQALSDPNAVLLDSHVFSPPMLKALGATPILSTQEPPNNTEKNVSTQQQLKEGDQ